MPGHQGRRCVDGRGDAGGHGLRPSAAAPGAAVPGANCLHVREFGICKRLPCSWSAGVLLNCLFLFYGCGVKGDGKYRSNIFVKLTIVCGGCVSFHNYQTRISLYVITLLRCYVIVLLFVLSWLTPSMVG